MNASQQSSGEPKILLVDDDSLIRTLVSSGLTRARMMVVQAKNGAEGLDKLAAEGPDLVLLDVHMPDMDGFEVLKAMHQKQQERDPPVIMLTADDDPASIEEAFEHGATDFITKPINLRLLEQRIRYAMAGHAREHHLRQLQIERTSACQIARLGFWRVLKDSSAIDWSEAAAELLARSDGLPASLEALFAEIHADDRLRVRKAFETAAAAGAPFNMEARLGESDSERIVRFSSPGRSENEELIGSFQDVTSLRRLEHQVAYLAEHDDLTGLPKQRLFSRFLDDMIQDTRSGQVVVLVISVDPILKLTEYFGSMGTREGILTIGARLHSAELEQAVFGRLDDGLFGIAMPIGDEDAGSLSSRLLAHLSQPITMSGRELPANLVVGGAIHPSDAHKPADLIKAAKLACRSAEEQRQPGIHFYNEGSQRDYASRLVLESDLRKACQEQQFFLVYQPQLEIQSGRIIGAEALLRWQHPRRGVVSPIEFIPVLEETGLIENAGAWVLEQAVLDAVRIRSAGHDLRIGVNLSAVQLLSESLPQKLSELCQRHGLPRNRLELEVTEGTAMQDPAKTRVLLNQLTAMGFSLSIDDFGTGHSSLAYITDFPMNTIKIDRSFVQNITAGRRQRAIVTAISALSVHLGLNTIAEGIETERQRDYVDALGVHEIQGFLIAKPLPLDQLLAFLGEHARAID